MKWRNKGTLIGIVIVCVSILGAAIYAYLTTRDVLSWFDKTTSKIEAGQNAIDNSRSDLPSSSISIQPQSSPTPEDTDAATAAYELICSIEELWPYSSDEVSVSVARTGTTQTINIVMPLLTESVQAAISSGTDPAGWDEIVDALCSISDDVPLLPGASSCKIYILSESSGDIFLTVYGGRVYYNVIKPPTESSRGPGYMTLAIFERISSGMTYDEVANLVGTPGVLLSEVNGTYYTAMYQWFSDNGTGNATVTFQSGKMVSKAQFGLQ